MAGLQHVRITGGRKEQKAGARLGQHYKMREDNNLNYPTEMTEAGEKKRGKTRTHSN